MIMPTRQLKKIQSDQRGFASMVIALVLVLVIALMTIGFAQLARREQQKALDKQLAIQANYAAETAINDAVADIQNNLITSAVSPTTCLHPATGATSRSTIDNTSGASYSCLLVNLRPQSLLKNPLAADSAWNIAFSTSAILGNLTITWSSADGHNTPNLSYAFNGLAPSSSWGLAPALLQFSVTPLNAGFTRDSLLNSMFTAYLYPSRAVPSLDGTNTATYVASPNPNNVVRRSGKCTAATPSICSVVINMGSLNTTGPFLVHIYGYYDASSVTLTGTAKVGGAPVNFVNGQAQIDATGKAKNVLKRLQARVPLNGLLNLPNYAIEGQNICKRFTTGPVPLTSSPDGLDASCGF